MYLYKMRKDEKNGTNHSCFTPAEQNGRDADWKATSFDGSADGSLDARPGALQHR